MWLHWVLVVTWDLWLQHVGSSSLTRDRTPGPHLHREHRGTGNHGKDGSHWGVRRFHVPHATERSETTRLAKCTDFADRECPSLDRFVSAQTKQGDSERRVLRPRGRWPGTRAHPEDGWESTQAHRSSGHLGNAPCTCAVCSFERRGVCYVCFAFQGFLVFPRVQQEIGDFTEKKFSGKRMISGFPPPPTNKTCWIIRYGCDVEPIEKIFFLCIKLVL